VYSIVLSSPGKDGHQSTQTVSSFPPSSPSMHEPSNYSSGQPHGLSYPEQSSNPNKSGLIQLFLNQSK